MGTLEVTLYLAFYVFTNIAAAAGEPLQGHLVDIPDMYELSEQGQGDLGRAHKKVQRNILVHITCKEFPSARDEREHPEGTASQRDYINDTGF